jgi:glycosyltransferase involved in cell wall biosynthesis
MRILYLHQHFSTPEGSSGTRSYEMARFLVNRGYQVTMVFGNSSRSASTIPGNYTNGMKRGQYQGIDLVEFDLAYSNKQGKVKRFITFLRFALRSLKLAFREQYDVLFATSPPLTIAIPGIMIKGFHKHKSFVFETRDLWPEGLRAVGVQNKPLLSFMEFLAYQVYNKADSCIALSPGVSEGIKRRLKNDKPIHLIPNGCDTDIFVPGYQSKSEMLGLNEDDFVAIFTGAHGFANGLDAALDAANELKSKDGGHNIKLLFVGDGVLKNRLKQRAKEEKLDNCIFMEPVQKLELVKIMQAADVGLMLLANYPEYYYGTSPNKFFDYISMGLPVLNNYPGWLAEIISENNIGKVIGPEDPGLFADTLIHMKANPEELKTMGNNARKLAEERFSRKQLAAKFSNALTATLS